MYIYIYIYTLKHKYISVHTSHVSVFIPPTYRSTMMAAARLTLNFNLLTMNGLVPTGNMSVITILQNNNNAVNLTFLGSSHMVMSLEFRFTAISHTYEHTTYVPSILYGHKNAVLSQNLSQNVYQKWELGRDFVHGG